MPGKADNSDGLHTDISSIESTDYKSTQPGREGQLEHLLARGSGQVTQSP